MAQFERGLEGDIESTTGNKLWCFKSCRPRLFVSGSKFQVEFLFVAVAS